MDVNLKGVIFARSWWEMAVSELSPGSRLEFYDAVLQYGFTGEVQKNLSQICKPLFAMVRPYLDEEAVRYQARVERNRSNAKGGAKATGSQSLPVAQNTNTNNNTNTTTNTTTSTISLPAERERFLCMSVIFGNGAANPIAELERFWNYYDSLGWRNNKGAEIVQKTSAARMWTPDVTIAEYLLPTRKAWAAAMAKSQCNDISIFTDFREARVRGETLTIYADHLEQFASLCDGQFLGSLRAFAKAMNCNSVNYHA